ncbi:hypothetical protein [Pseudodonghicola flavimaris]|uniref:Uncharacterized protein n=1 Tax=Pseudodonghicola flavimaris TaxID=3050036 RepID=A0ABT7F3J4_9RHOB|nr:hypothetical protein [Pseudodonghicola flavimaris]MDK3019055.1 hypothetical protein [Pseudodonghicola flavimaris]
MVKAIFTGTIPTDQAHGAMGFLSLHFNGFFDVEGTMPTGFAVTYGFPFLPDVTPVDEAPDLYFGR